MEVEQLRHLPNLSAVVRDASNGGRVKDTGGCGKYGKRMVHVRHAGKHC